MNANSGNILFVILIAVILFAALSYAVTSTGRNSGPSPADDKLNIEVSKLFNSFSAIQTAMMRLKLINGCTDGEFEFSNNTYKTQGGTPIVPINPNAASDQRCDLFSVKGGNVVPYVIPSEFSGDYPASATNPQPGHAEVAVSQILNVGTDGPQGTISANDIFLSYTFKNEKLCLRINEKLDIKNDGGAPPTDESVGEAAYYDGSLNATRIYNNPAISGKRAFCTRIDEDYYLKLVILAR